ncbi:hypothetical protein Emag_005970 [Eimeria magna]
MEFVPTEEASPFPQGEEGRKARASPLLLLPILGLELLAPTDRLVRPCSLPATLTCGSSRSPPEQTRTHYPAHIAQGPYSFRRCLSSIHWWPLHWWNPIHEACCSLLQPSLKPQKAPAVSDASADARQLRCHTATSQQQQPIRQLLQAHRQQQQQLQQQQQQQHQQQCIQVNEAVRDFLQRSCTPGSRLNRAMQGALNQRQQPQQREQQQRQHAAAGWTLTPAASHSASVQQQQQPQQQRTHAAAAAAAAAVASRLNDSILACAGPPPKAASSSSLPFVPPFVEMGSAGPSEPRESLFPMAARAPRAMLSSGRPLSGRGPPRERVIVVHARGMNCISICCCDPTQATTGWLLSRVLEHMTEAGVEEAASQVVGLKCASPRSAGVPLTAASRDWLDALLQDGDRPLSLLPEGLHVSCVYASTANHQLKAATAAATAPAAAAPAAEARAAAVVAAQGEGQHAISVPGAPQKTIEQLPASVDAAIAAAAAAAAAAAQRVGQLGLRQPPPASQPPPSGALQHQTSVRGAAAAAAGGGSSSWQSQDGDSTASTLSHAQPHRSSSSNSSSSSSSSSSDGTALPRVRGLVSSPFPTSSPSKASLASTYFIHGGPLRGPQGPPRTLRGSCNLRCCLCCFSFERQIGKGGFSRVFRVRSNKSGKLLAVKAVKKEKLEGDTQRLRRALAEREVMASCQSPFILQLYCSFQTQKELFFVTEFCPGGDLAALLRCHKRFSEDVVRFVAVEVLLGLQHLQRQRVVYRDLKAANILVDLDGHCRLADFGLAKRLTGQLKKTFSFCGSPEYLSPEVLLGTGHDQKVDLYSLGCLLFELLVGVPPFFAANRNVMYIRIMQGRLSFPSSCEASPEARALVSRLLALEPLMRIGACGGVEEVMQHRWFAGVSWNVTDRLRARSPLIPLLRNAREGDSLLSASQDLLEPSPYACDIGLWSPGPLCPFQDFDWTNPSRLEDLETLHVASAGIEERLNLSAPAVAEAPSLVAASAAAALTRAPSAAGGRIAAAATGGGSPPAASEPIQAAGKQAAGVKEDDSACEGPPKGEAAGGAAHGAHAHSNPTPPTPERVRATAERDQAEESASSWLKDEARMTATTAAETECGTDAADSAQAAEASTHGPTQEEVNQQQQQQQQQQPVQEGSAGGAASARVSTEALAECAVDVLVTRQQDGLAPCTLRSVEAAGEGRGKGAKSSLQTSVATSTDNSNSKNSNSTSSGSLRPAEEDARLACAAAQPQEKAQRTRKVAPLPRVAALGAQRKAEREQGPNTRTASSSFFSGRGRQGIGKSFEQASPESRPLASPSQARNEIRAVTKGPLAAPRRQADKTQAPPQAAAAAASVRVAGTPSPGAALADRKRAAEARHVAAQAGRATRQPTTGEIRSSASAAVK